MTTFNLRILVTCTSIYQYCLTTVYYFILKTFGEHVISHPTSYALLFLGKGKSGDHVHENIYGINHVILPMNHFDSIVSRKMLHTSIP